MRKITIEEIEERDRLERLKIKDVFSMFKYDNKLPSVSKSLHEYKGYDIRCEYNVIHPYYIDISLSVRTHRTDPKVTIWLDDDTYHINFKLYENKIEDQTGKAPVTKLLNVISYCANDLIKRKNNKEKMFDEFLEQFKNEVT